MGFWKNYKKKLVGELTRKDYNKLSKKEKKIKLMKDIHNHKQTMWIWIIVAIVLSWTGIGLIVGIIGAIWAHELKNKKEIILATLE